jgi:hypothetical protein
VTGSALSGNSLSGNAASVGGGIRNFLEGMVTLNNTIVANSPAGGDLLGTFVGSHNLIGAGSTSNLTRAVPGEM